MNIVVEDVQKHEFQDIYRLCPGVLLIVNKYKSLGYVSCLKKEHLKGVRGMKGLSVLKHDFSDKRGGYSGIPANVQHFPAGTYVHHSHYPIVAAASVADYRIELKSSGGEISGSVKDMEKFTKTVNDILARYKGGASQ